MAFSQDGVGRDGRGALDDTAADGVAFHAEDEGALGLDDTGTGVPATRDRPASERTVGTAGAGGGGEEHDPFAAFVDDGEAFAAPARAVDVESDLVLEDEANEGTRAELRLEEHVAAMGMGSGGGTSVSTGPRWIEEEDLGLGEMDLVLGGIDPEAGKEALRRDFSVRAALGSQEGRLLMAMVASTIALGVAAYAAVDQQRPSIVTAAVLVPPATLWGFLSWRHWLQGQLYSVRLLESLGEDATDLRRAAEERAKRRVERAHRRASEKLSGVKR